MAGFTIADFERVPQSLPPHPVAPENRRVARLHPAPYVARGQMYRLAAQPEWTGHNRPLIVMNTEDVSVLRASFVTVVGIVDVDQEIADIAEQLFAEQEAKGR